MAEQNSYNALVYLSIITSLLLIMLFLKEVVGVKVISKGSYIEYVEKNKPKLKEEKQNDLHDVPNSKKLVDSTEEQTRTQMAKSDTTTQIAQKATTESNISDEKYFEDLKNAYLTEVTNRVLKGKNRTDVIVRYYQREPDNNTVKALKDLKFYLHFRPVPDSLINQASNSLYYGDSVSTRDIQLIAWSLISNGIDLRQITPSKYHNNWKAKAVEIGADSKAQNLPKLTALQIREFQNPFLSEN